MGLGELVPQASKRRVNRSGGEWNGTALRIDQKPLQERLKVAPSQP